MVNFPVMAKTVHKQGDKELLLIGTVHGDPDGAIRLREILRRENPDLILVEVSPYGLAYRKRNMRRLRILLRRRLNRIARVHGISWKSRSHLQALFARIQMPFEYRSSFRFCRDNDAEFHCIDLSSESKRLITEQWEEMFGLPNLEALMREPPEGLRLSIEKTYGLASRLVGEAERSLLNPYVREWMEDPGWQKREAHLAEEIHRRFGQMIGGRLAYVGGWQHLLYPTDAGTVCDRLAHLQPRRVLTR